MADQPRPLFRSDKTNLTSMYAQLSEHADQIDKLRNSRYLAVGDIDPTLRAIADLQDKIEAVLVSGVVPVREPVRFFLGQPAPKDTL